jgi:hypothetical protein
MMILRDMCHFAPYQGMALGGPSPDLSPARTLAPSSQLACSWCGRRRIVSYTHTSGLGLPVGWEACDENTVASPEPDGLESVRWPSGPIWCPHRHPACTAQADPMVVPYRRAARGHRYHAPRTHHAGPQGVGVPRYRRAARDRWCHAAQRRGFRLGPAGPARRLAEGSRARSLPGCEPDDRSALARLRANDLSSTAPRRSSSRSTASTVLQVTGRKMSGSPWTSTRTRPWCCATRGSANRSRRCSSPCSGTRSPTPAPVRCGTSWWSAGRATARSDQRFYTERAVSLGPWGAARAARGARG